MSQISFDNFAQAARRDHLSDTEIAGRYAFQAEAERLILPDVVAKLAIGPADRLLEIGCGPGNLLIPLAYLAATATGIDNEPAIARLRARAPLAENLEGLAGNFLDLDFGDRRFDKILIYSVLHYLASADEVLRFVDKALALCAPGGRILLGDLTNGDRKARFARSAEGARVRRQWEAQVAGAGGHAFDSLPADGQLVVINDELLLTLVRHCRGLGFEAHLLPQPANLPFGGSREDILIYCHTQPNGSL